MGGVIKVGSIDWRDAGFICTLRTIEDGYKRQEESCPTNGKGCRLVYVLH